MRVFNDDRLAPGAVWPLHPHKDVEGLTYVVEGTFRIWILSDTPDLDPAVEQRVFTAADRTDRLLEVVGPSGPSVVKVHQDASVLVSRLNPGTEVRHQIGEGRGVYAYLIGGEATFDGEPVVTGDAAKVTAQDALRIRATGTSELILVDVPLEFPRVGLWANRT